MTTTFMSSPSLFLTSESVTEGHPDKMCDQISDAVLDAILREDPHGRVACETAVTTGLVVVAAATVLTLHSGASNGDVAAQAQFKLPGGVAAFTSNIPIIVLRGERAGAVRLFNPGVVEVLCNMHARMRANVLVVPNHHHVKASGDGSFRLENVPVGSRQLVAWTPDAKPVTESVTLTAAGANVKFSLQVESAPPPMDKLGKLRPAYRQEE